MMKWRIDRFLYQKKKTVGTRILFLPLYLLSIPYGWAIRLRNALYSSHLLKTYHLPCPVISIGNITVGGTGKTPLVMALAKGLQDRGISVSVLSRGYKGERASGPVVSDGKTIYLSSKEAGDEPYLMATRLRDTPVLVGRDRFANGRIALQRFGTRGILLDDGCQHLRLHRDLNILLIDSTLGFGDRHLLPRGILREPLSHLRRADLFILTKVERPEACQPLESLIQRIHPSAPIFHSYDEALGLVGPHGEWDNLHLLKGKKVLAFSGIANPSSFLSLLKKCGMKVIKEAVFPDHYAYTQQDIISIEEEGKEADWIVTTEKDLVRLADLKIGPLPIRALRIEMKLREKTLFPRVMRLFEREEKGEE